MSFFLFIWNLDAFAVDYPFNYGAYDISVYNQNAVPNRPQEPPFTDVINKFGPLKVKEGFFKSETLIKPWSSWWYPRFEKTLFDDSTPNGPSTLTRYDEYVKKLTGESPQSRNYEEENLFSNQAASWEGLCYAWSIASLMEKEPVKAISLQGVKFRIQDLKALQIKIYEGSFLPTSFGQRNNAAWNSVYEDIYPEQFHRFLQVEIFDKKLPFNMDLDAGYQIWNVPVFKVETKISKNPNDPKNVHVKTWVYAASPFVLNLNFVGTSVILKVYTYDLYGKWDEGGEFLADYGIWTDNSRWDHPDYLMPRPNSAIKKIRNTKLNIHIIDEILNSTKN
ncbi:MAG: hypothetical protein ACHQYQ_05055 [Bacteriovoracales bacterium]